MNVWLQKTARQHQEKNLSRTFVALLPNASELLEVAPRVAGYYALAATSVETGGMQTRKLPRTVSAVLVARLAVDMNSKRKGLGETLLMHALRTVVVASDTIGVQCVVVDAIDANAAAFYAKYGFAPLTNNPLRLFLAVATIPRA